MWAMVVNRFFSSVVRLQTDRGHHVIDSGPYRVVRHPGYAGIVASAPAGGIVIGSLWSLLPLAVMAVLLLRRLRMEDAFLHRELAGYPDYAKRVRYRLLPLW
jgi:protein-S-isoprenylcysteine O-methyltransferase Ste14